MMTSIEAISLFSAACILQMVAEKMPPVSWWVSSRLLYIDLCLWFWVWLTLLLSWSHRVSMWFWIRTRLHLSTWSSPVVLCFLSNGGTGHSYQISDNPCLPVCLITFRHLPSSRLGSGPTGKDSTKALSPSVDKIYQPGGQGSLHSYSDSYLWFLASSGFIM